MSVGKLKKISVTEKEYVLKDISTYSSQEKVITIKLSDVEFSGIEPSKVIKIIARGGSNYMYATDKMVYRTWSDDLNFFYEFPVSFNKPFDVIDVCVWRMNGGVLLYDTQYTKITDFYDMYADRLQGGISAIQVKGRIILLNNGVLKVSEPFNYIDGAISFKFKFLASFPIFEFGNAVALVMINGKVYVINQKAILYFHLALKDRDCLCEKLPLQPLDVYSNSVIIINYIAYMISNKKLVVFDGESVKHIKGLLDDLNVEEFSSFSTDGVRYYANVKLVDQTRYTYVYDTITGEEILGDYYKLICRDMPYVYDEEQDAIRLINVGSENVIKSEGSLEAIEDLGTCAEKIVTGYEMHVLGSAELIVGGEFGEKTFTIKSGCNSARCNLNSKEFNFKFINPSSDFKLIKAKIKYRTCGE